MIEFTIIYVCDDGLDFNLHTFAYFGNLCFCDSYSHASFTLYGALAQHGTFLPSFSWLEERTVWSFV